MFKFKYIFYIVILVIIGCKSQLQKSRELNFNQDNFNSNLSKYYINFAEEEAEKYDWSDSEYFAKKAILASNYVNVLPENPNNWNIKDSTSKEEILSAYGILNSFLNDQIKELYPMQLAQAQVNYDCWIEELEEGWQKDDIKKCKDSFLKSINEINKLSRFKKNNKLKIFYEFKKAKLSVNQISQIQEFIKLQNVEKNCTMHIEGHADYTGDEEYNNRLSLLRAQKVAQVIKIESAKQIKGYGYKRNLIKTDKGVKEKRNRRVEIYVLCNK